MEKYFKRRYLLTEREAVILKYLIQGYMNTEIADKLNLSVHTIKAHVSSLLTKFNVNTRVALAVYVVKDCFYNNVPV
ncbi:TPA: hypothetical protein CPT80_04855 [Candidatus Gastranaerophilales bacterium HUM_9]|nr:MAG TPA: hypothetical protein CPT80_04855 [Candidatus Gastranaerophilales bacterium HUM_9]HBX34839.1 hypothetical protein [Cyanobacteria bacterium UBA11440]